MDPNNHFLILQLKTHHYISHLLHAGLLFGHVRKKGFGEKEANCTPYIPSEARHTVYGDAAAGLLSKFGVEQLEPVIHDLGGRRGTIIKRPVLKQKTHIIK